MTKLSVNVNKIATLRNARGGNVPDVIKMSLAIESFGADGITVHPRPDERHIRFTDVFELKEVLTTEFNIEGYPTSTFLQLVSQVRPTQVTLVPDPPDVLTSNAGWDTFRNGEFLKDVVTELKSQGMRVSLFIDPGVELLEYTARTGTDRVELYTEAYAANYSNNPHAAIKPYIETANMAIELGMGVNAGHDLSLENLAFFNRMIPELLEVSIGHALISDALSFGLARTVLLYKKCLQLTDLNRQ